jgi:hypothetical protein
MIIRRKGFRVAVVASAMVLLFVADWGWEAWREPRFEGHGIRYWIDLLPDVSKREETAKAMRSFGEDAVPYLVAATRKTRKWENGFLAKIPRRIVNRIVDIQHLINVENFAAGVIEDLVQEEIQRNELLPEAEARYPVTDQLIPIWKKELRGAPSDRLMRTLWSFGPKGTNFSPELKMMWQRMNPSADFWMGVTFSLAETGDSNLTPGLLYWANVENWVNVKATPMTAVEVKRTAIRALGRNGQVTDPVISALRRELQSTNEEVSIVTIAACAELGVCMEEALAKIREKRSAAPWQRPEAAQYCELVDPILRWRADTNSSVAAHVIRANLSPNARPIGRAEQKRSATAELLGRAGPGATQFTEDLAVMARDPDRNVRLSAIRALRKIDRREAERVLRSRQ